MIAKINHSSSKKDKQCKSVPVLSTISDTITQNTKEKPDALFGFFCVFLNELLIFFDRQANLWELKERKIY